MTTLLLGHYKSIHYGDMYKCKYKQMLMSSWMNFFLFIFQTSCKANSKFVERQIILFNISK